MTSKEQPTETARRTVLKAIGAAGGVAGLAGAGPPAVTAQDGDDGESVVSEGPLVRLESAAEGLTAPVDFQFADEEPDRRFIVDQTGQIYVHGEEGIEDEPFLDLGDRLVELNEEFDERGLLGLAFHPDFEENGRFYVRYSAPPRDAEPAEYVPPRDDVMDDYDHTFVLSEFETDGDDNETADPDSERVLLEIPQPQANHNAGPLAFGPEGLLYVATGDGGDANDTGEGHVEDWYDENDGGNGQNTTENLLGGILRIDVDEEGDDRPYGVPADNPFAEEGEFDSEAGLAEYYAWGLRNPWGMSFHDETLFVADVGQELYEEVNIVEQGGNYGWNVKEGTNCFSPESPGEPPEECPDETPDDVRGGEPLLDPIVEYPQETEDEAIGTAVIGGHVYENEEIPDLTGSYVFGDWSEPAEEPRGKLFRAVPPDEGEDGGSGGGGPHQPPTDDGDDDGVEPWEMEALRVEVGDDSSAGDGEDGGDGGGDGAAHLGRYLLDVGRDQGGQLYALTTEESGPTGDTGEVLQLVPADVGEEGDEEDGGDGADGEAVTIELEGTRGGWEGVAPSEIEGERNPTLELPAGATAEVTWENADGLPHNFVVETEDGEDVVETELLDGTGETQTVEFEVTEDMAVYYCAPHRGSMNGDIEITE